MKEKSGSVTAETTVLDIIHCHRQTEAIFKRLVAESGACVCREGLFLTLREAAARFGFHAGDVLAEIRAAIRDAGVQADNGDVSAAAPARSGRLPASRRRVSQR